jgi:hypothetical protein
MIGYGLEYQDSYIDRYRGLHIQIGHSLKLTTHTHLGRMFAVVYFTAL